MFKSERSETVIKRTYSRAKADGSLESWEDIQQRVKNHQRWLWERAVGRELNKKENAELDEFIRRTSKFMCSSSGRTNWMSDQDIGKEREIAHFNCAATEVATVNDYVDFYWALLQGAGMGGLKVKGSLNGFKNYIKDVVVIPSERTDKGGREHNTESYSKSSKTWTISIGDSAEAWAKSIGKLLAGKNQCDKLVLDFSQIRPEGMRLRGYGWISSGYKPLAKAYEKICKIMNAKAGQLLNKVDMLDICNLLGDTLSSRRSAEIMFYPFDDPEFYALATAKKNYWLKDAEHRKSSNNTTIFEKKPTLDELSDFFDLMVDNGGSDPGLLNKKQALKRAPWFKLTNPCCEILLGSKSVCNLTEINLNAKEHRDSFEELMMTVYLVSRANYRQTLVDFRDGILQPEWHQNNEYLRLCGVGLTGVVQRPDLTEYDYQTLRKQAIYGAYSMADELGTQRPKNVTTIKPSGTMSKVFECSEGVHKPIGKHTLNNITFSAHDPIIPRLREAGYRIIPKPQEEGSVLVTFPFMYDNVTFEKFKRPDGKIVEVNLESAVSQLNRYKMLMDNWCDQNVSCTISYSLDEIPSMVSWVYDNWDSIVGLSFMFRADPTKTAADLGHPYLPQEVVWEEKFIQECERLKPINFEGLPFFDEVEITDGCDGGACPIK